MFEIIPHSMSSRKRTHFIIYSTVRWFNLREDPAYSLTAAENNNLISAERLHSPNECPVFDIKPSDVEVPVLEFWGMSITNSFPLLPSQFWPVVVASNRFLSIGQKELFDI